MASKSIKIGEQVRAYREARRLTLSDLAKKSAVSRSYLYQVESGISSPTEDKLSSLAEALDVTVADLVGLHAPENIPEALSTFAKNAGLSPSDISMLANIHYRGKQPTTVEGWRMLYSVIKASADSDA